MVNREAFINELKPGAIGGWKTHSVLPSITIAQGILESAWGQSELATKANNLFGIKASADWEGEVYEVNTWEVIDGKNVTVKADFRKYDKKSDSIKDHGGFFTSTPWRVNNYKHVVGEKDYKKVAQALSDAGYATDPDYPSKLINIIETYNLQKVDEEALRDNQDKKEDNSNVEEVLRKLLEITDVENILRTLSEIEKALLLPDKEPKDDSKEETVKEEPKEEPKKGEGDNKEMSKKYKVAIDIGHGSNTFPTNGKGVRVNGVGYAEHTFNSITSNKLKTLLENSNIEVVWLQQPYSPDIPLATRTNWYRNQNLDLIVSVHANANGSSAVNGRCAFFWHTAPRARRLAEIIIQEIRAKGYTTHGNGLHPSVPGTWTNLHMARVPANWANPVPSVLVEYGFMTGNRDFDLVFGSQQGKYTTDMADATAKAICAFLGTAYRGGNASSPSAPISTSSSSETHTVKAGDTLWAIAQANGITVDELKSMNNLDSNIINVGQKLTVKVKEDKKDDVILTRPNTYTIVAGDTLGEVSVEFGVKLEDLVKWNNISNPNVVNVGQVIKLRPDATVPAPTPAKAPKLVVGETVRIKSSASTYATGQTIPASVKNRNYTIMQVGTDRVLLQEIMSWVRKTDIEGYTSTSSPTPKPAQKTTSVKAGDRVRIKSSASRYATGETIPASIKGRTYTVMQVGNGRALLQEIMSWVNTSDISGGTTSAPTPTPIKVGDRVRIKSSASKYATGQTIPASVKGKTYTVQQVGNGRVLLKEIISWVRTSDVTK